MTRPVPTLPRTFSAGDEGIRLVEELLSRGTTVRLRVTGRSMLPWLEDGAVVTLRPAFAAAVGAGDLVLIRAADACPVLHRVVLRQSLRDGTCSYIVKGDSCAVPDGEVPEGGILGKVVAVTRITPGGRVREVNFESGPRVILHRVLAVVSYRSPRVFSALSRRFVPSWRNFRENLFRR